MNTMISEEIKTTNGTIVSPKGFLAQGIHSGLRKKLDLSIIYSKSLRYVPQFTQQMLLRRHLYYGQKA